MTSRVQQLAAAAMFAFFVASTGYASGKEGYDDCEKYIKTCQEINKTEIFPAKFCYDMYWSCVDTVDTDNEWSVFVDCHSFLPVCNAETKNDERCGQLDLLCKK
ncbi:MAG: hypothetical protein NTV34_09045 [Proteobacteria bacterium]|nr:hypothetical protein [Pseudomonadota bacterium]